MSRMTINGWIITRRADGSTYSEQTVDSKAWIRMNAAVNDVPADDASQDAFWDKYEKQCAKERESALAKFRVSA